MTHESRKAVGFLRRACNGERGSAQMRAQYDPAARSNRLSRGPDLHVEAAGAHHRSSGPAFTLGKRQKRSRAGDTEPPRSLIGAGDPGPETPVMKIMGRGLRGFVWSADMRATIFPAPVLTTTRQALASLLRTFSGWARSSSLSAIICAPHLIYSGTLRRVDFIRPGRAGRAAGPGTYTALRPRPTRNGPLPTHQTLL